MAYKIIRGGSDTEVATKVETAQQEGWQCQGGISLSVIYKDTYYFEYAQAMVREDKVPVNIHPSSMNGDVGCLMLDRRVLNSIAERIGMQGLTELAQAPKEDFFPEFNPDIHVIKKSELPYKVGDIVKIVGNTTRHCFNIGDEVLVDSIREYKGKPYIQVKVGNKEWCAYFEDIVLVRRRPSMSKAPTI